MKLPKSTVTAGTPTQSKKKKHRQQAAFLMAINLFTLFEKLI